MMENNQMKTEMGRNKGRKGGEDFKSNNYQAQSLVTAVLAQFYGYIGVDDSW